jgi:hypothetical protein
MRYAICHPELPHEDHGLCKKCASKRYRTIHKEEVAKRNAAYQKARPDLNAQKSKRWRYRNPEGYMLVHVRNRARRRGVEFTITTADVFIPECCPVLGTPLRCSTLGKPGGVDSSPSLDRINPRLGYVPGNVVVISHRANTIKNSGTAEEHEKIAAWMRRLEQERELGIR